LILKTKPEIQNKEREEKDEFPFHDQVEDRFYGNDRGEGKRR